MNDVPGRKIQPRVRKKPASDTPEPSVEIEPYQEAVNNASARVRGLWLGFVALMAYLFISVFAVTHRDLLLQNPVKLPVLNVDLPLTGFFFVAPLFFLINYFYLLLQLLGLSRRIKEFNAAIKKAGLDHKSRRAERRRLDTFVIVLMLGGTWEEQKGWTSWALYSIARITLVLAPVALLLFFQLQFLAYQSPGITWWHRIVLLIGIVLLCVFWPSIRSGGWASAWKMSVRGAIFLPVLFFATVLATFPGEYFDSFNDPEKWEKPQDSFLTEYKELIFGELPCWKPDCKERLFFAREAAKNESAFKRNARLLTGVILPLPFSRAINLPDKTDIIDLDRYDKILKRFEDNGEGKKLWASGRTLELRERNLRGARFDRSDLRHLDFYKSSLQGASLFGASLQGASLDRASLLGASLFSARLQGASLDETSLQGASLLLARLQGASLVGARLQGASLVNANLQGASLVGARLQGASLTNISLWRAYGSPDTGDPTEVRVQRPILEPLTKKQFAKIEEQALVGVTEETVQEEIKKKLEWLKDPAETDDDKRAAAYWNGLEGKLGEEKYRAILVEVLEEQACGDDARPYVAQGIITNVRLEAVGPEHLPALAQKLLDGATDKPEACPGAVGLDEASIAKLRIWAKQKPAPSP